MNLSVDSSSLVKLKRWANGKLCDLGHSFERSTPGEAVFKVTVLSVGSEIGPECESLLHRGLQFVTQGDLLCLSDPFLSLFKWAPY